MLARIRALAVRKQRMMTPDAAQYMSPCLLLCLDQCLSCPSFSYTWCGRLFTCRSTLRFSVPASCVSSYAHSVSPYTLILKLVIYTTIGDVSPKSVLTNLSTKFDRFLAVRSQFDTGHRVNLYAHTCCQSASFGPLFALYCPFFLTEKKLTMSQFATDALFRCVLYAALSRRCRHRRLLKLRTAAHNFAHLRTMVNFIVLSIKLVFMVLCVSYSRVLYNN